MAQNFRLAAQLPLAARAGGGLTITGHPSGLYLRASRQTLLAAEADRALARDIELLLVRQTTSGPMSRRCCWLRYVPSQQAPGCAHASTARWG